MAGAIFLTLANEVCEFSYIDLTCASKDATYEQNKNMREIDLIYHQKVTTSIGFATLAKSINLKYG